MAGDAPARTAEAVADHGASNPARAGLQPEHGHEQVWVGREVVRGAIQEAATLRQATAPVRASLLRASARSARPVLDDSSDAHEAIRLAVAEVFTA